MPNPAEGHEWLAHEATARYGAPGELDEKGWLRRISPVPKTDQKPHPLIFQALTMSEGTIRWAAREGVMKLMEAVPQMLGQRKSGKRRRPVASDLPF